MPRAVPRTTAAAVPTAAYKEASAIWAIWVWRLVLERVSFETAACPHFTKSSYVGVGITQARKEHGTKQVCVSEPS